ncbi:exported hypothetical protein [Mesotoga infera]|nr:exported hypothetical protein [Mesotoga infera]
MTFLPVALLFQAISVSWQANSVDLLDGGPLTVDLLHPSFCASFVVSSLIAPSYTPMSYPRL